MSRPTPAPPTALRLLVAVLAVLAVISVPVADGQPHSNSSAQAALDPDPEATAEILAVYPNPVTYQDRGEFVLLDLPERGNWSVADDHSMAPIPSNATGTVAVSTDPEAIEPFVEYEVLAIEDGIQLADAGDTVRLLRDGREVDSVTYGRATQGDVFDVRAGEWRALGATEFESVAADPEQVETFALPDSPEVPTEVIEEADERIVLAAYTFSSWEVAHALADARERGVEMRVLVDGRPVGGVTEPEAEVIDWLDGRGVPIEVLDGDRARHRFHHAKYAVADDRALVMTENWNPSGTGGRSSRGWGTVVHSPDLADYLVEVFEADTGWHDTVPWEQFRANRSFRSSEEATGSFRTVFEPETVPADSARLLVAPDNAERETVAKLHTAEESILVKQVGIGGPEQPFLEATIEAARRGVEVKILLSSAWYVRDDNRELAHWLNELADEEGLDLEARLAEPRGRYEKIHAKGVVIDEERVLVGSVNWNNHSIRENREVVVSLEGEEVGTYYAELFVADWRGGLWEVPVGVPVAVLVVGGLAGFAARRVEWTDDLEPVDWEAEKAVREEVG